MSSGLPCVIGNMEGIGSYIKGNTESILIPEDERVESYIAKLNDLIDSKELRAKIGLYARQRILSKFFYKDIAKNILKYIQICLEGKHFENMHADTKFFQTLEVQVQALNFQSNYFKRFQCLFFDH